MSWIETLIFLIVLIYLATIVGGGIVSIKDYISELDDPPLARTPKELYDDCFRLNWIGVVLLYIVHILANPLYYIFCILVWLMTFGRDSRN